MGRIRPDPAEARLARALVDHAARAGVAASVAAARARPWSSATFTGSQHRLTLSAPAGPARAAWLAALPGAELAVRGHVVADVAIDAATPETVELTVLLLQDA